MKSVVLNGIEYPIQGEVQRTILEEFPVQYRTTGQQQRSDRQLMSAQAYGQFDYGFGVERADITETIDMKSFWDSGLDTRFPKQITLPPLRVEAGVVPATYAGKLYNDMMAADMSNLYVFGQGNGSICDYFRYNVGTNAFQRIGQIGQAGFEFVQTLCRLDFSPIENKWCFVAHIGGAINCVKMIKASNFNPQIYTGGTLSVYIPTCGHFRDLDDSMAWLPVILSGVSSFYQDVGSAISGRRELNHPSELTTTPDGNYAGYSDGIFKLDLTAKTLTNKYDLASIVDKSNARDIKTFESDQIMVTQREGLAAFDTGANTIQQIGPNLHHGLPSSRRGEISALASTYQYLFGAINPRLSTDKATIMAYDTYGWHFIGQIPTAGVHIGQLLVSANPDGIPRLWAQPDGCWPQKWDFPLTNPLTEASYSFATQGKMDYPIFDAGMPEWDKGFYDVVVHGYGLSSLHTIEVFYGLDGAAATQSLGIATQPGSTTMKFASGLGVTGKTIQLAPQLTRGTLVGTAPYMTGLVLHYLGYPPRRDQYDFLVDLKAIANRKQVTIQAVLATLSALSEVHTLVPFYYGGIGTKNVKLLPPLSRGEASEAGRGIQAGDILADTVAVKVAEIAG